MNINSPLRSVMMALALATTASLGTAQTTNNPTTFDADGSSRSWIIWNGWGMQGWPLTWDGILDAAGDPASGSLRYEIPFVGAGDEQIMTFGTFANGWGWDERIVVDATTYTNLAFDIIVDPSSGTTAGGNYGNMDIGLVTKGWGQIKVKAGYTIPLSATNWTHVDAPIDPTAAGLDTVVGFYFYMWSGGAHKSTLIFNLDNVQIQQPEVVVSNSPPTVAMVKATSKLNLIATGTADWQRQNICTVESNFTWVGSSAPITYALTIKDSPGVAYPGFQAHMFLLPNSSGYTGSDPDWGQPDIIFLEINNLANGGGQATLRYKTNSPSNNDMIYNGNPLATNSAGALITVGSLGTVTSTNIVGTWKMTFNNNTDVTVVSPDGTTTNLSIATEASPLFAGDLRVYVGAQGPNDANYFGQGYVFDGVKISTPNATLLEDNFTADSLDPLKWEVRAGDAKGVVLVPASSHWWLTWTLPAIGFNPQVGSSFGAGSTWKATSSSSQLQIKATKRVLLNASDLASNAGFFRMIKRSATKLQVLMPGETAAPGTPTGKTGTPAAQPPGVPFDVTVNIVDDTWNVVTYVSHTVKITSSDDTATLPSDAALVNGTRLFSVTFGSEGTFTITATDVTDATKTSDTGTPTVSKN